MLASIVGDLLMLAAIGAVNEFAVHLFVKERILSNGVIASGMSLVTFVAVIQMMPDFKGLLRTDAIDFTTTFFVPGLLCVIAVAAGAGIIFRFSQRFLRWREAKILMNTRPI